MRIASIAAGAAGMYCGSCIHDNTLAAALLKQGHEVALIPTYTPIRTDEHEVTIDRVFFGALNVFLQQKFSLFQKTPEALDRWLDRPGLLSWVSKMGSSTDATELGALTLSMLQGEDGRQKKELDKLVDWLETYEPDVVQLTNSMFLGMAGPIRRRLGVPVICGLTGEDLFLDALSDPFGSEVRDELRRRADDADLFVATSRWYQEFMADYLAVETDRIRVVPLGIQTEGFRDELPEATDRPPTIGYLARLCPEKGLHLLVDSFLELANDPALPGLELHIAGYLGARDELYWQECLQKLEAAGAQDRVRHAGEVDREQKLEFLSGLDVFSVPTTYREPKGLSILEALAQGVPVVQPDHGTFPEMIERTGGGVLFEPHSNTSLTTALRTLLLDPARRAEHARSGHRAVRDVHSADRMARDTITVYQQALAD